MTRTRMLGRLVMAALGTFLAAAATAQAVAQAPEAGATSSTAAPEPAVAPFRPGIEPRAIEILKAASARLAAAKSMAFTAVVSYEGPSLLGPPLVYSDKSLVTMRRPD